MEAHLPYELPPIVGVGEENGGGRRLGGQQAGEKERQTQKAREIELTDARRVIDKLVLSWDPKDANSIECKAEEGPAASCLVDLDQTQQTCED